MIIAEVFDEDGQPHKDPPPCKARLASYMEFMKRRIIAATEQE